MKIRIVRTNGTVIEAEGDAAECEAFMRGALANASTPAEHAREAYRFLVSTGGFITHRDVERGLIDALDAAGRGS
jgi:hypothetical protein